MELERKRWYESGIELDDVVDKSVSIGFQNAIEIVKKYENDGWVSVNDNLPTTESTQLNRVQYLTSSGDGFYQVMSYCEGWNCFRDFDGFVQNKNEIKSVVTWKEIEPYKGE